MIFILDRQLKIIGTLKNDGGAFQASPFFDDSLTEDLATGAETFQFKTILTRQASENLVIGNYVAFKRDGKTKLFQIVQTVQDHQEVVYCEVYCECAGLELINNVFRKTTFISIPLRKFMESVLADTTWSVGYIDGTLLTPQDLSIEDASVYSILQDNIPKFGGEIEFRVELKKGRIINKFVDVYAHRGKNTGKRFEFGKDIESIVRKIDSTNLYTALIGIGNNNISFKDVEVAGINKPKGQDFVFDQASFDRYNNNGYHLMGVFKVDTDSPEELLRKTFEQLQKVKEPQFLYEIQVALLGELLGESWNTVRIGDRVSIVDNAFNPPIHLMARVSKLVTSETNPDSNSCVLSNFVEVSSNISKEMKEMASQLKGYVEGTVSSKFPIGSEDIKKGAIKTEHIYQNSITTDLLKAGCVTSEKIDTKYLESVEGKFKKLTSDQADFKKLTADEITSLSASIKKLSSEYGEFNTLLAGKADVVTLTALDSKFKQLAVDQATLKDVLADKVSVKELNAINASLKTLTTEQASIKNILADKVSTKDIQAINALIEKIQAKSIETDKLLADKASIESLSATNANLEKLQASLAEVNKVIANKIDASYLTAINASIKELVSEQGTIKTLVSGNLTANNIKVGSLTGDRFAAKTITANQIATGTITADSGILAKGCITEAFIADAAITSAKLSKASVGALQLVDGCVSSAKIGKGQIENAHIKDATIESSKIKELVADKITSGTFDAGRITVKNLRADSITTGSLTVDCNNLIHNSALRVNTDKWVCDPRWVIDTSRKFEGVNSLRCDVTGLTQDNWTMASTERVPINIGDTVVVSVWAYTDNRASLDRGAGMECQWFSDKTSDRLPHQRGIGIVPSQDGVWQRFVYSTKVDEPNTKYMNIRFHPVRNGRLWISKPMISKGSVTGVWRENNDELIGDGAIKNSNLGDNVVTANKLNLEDLFSSSAFIGNLQTVNINAEQITTGKISGVHLDIDGLVEFSSLGDSLKNEFIFDTSSNKVFINGGAIYANSITADKINAKGLTITNKNNDITFKITDEGDTFFSGDIQSSNYNDITKTGYLITRDGDVVFNKATIRGDVILPNAGMTNFGDQLAGVNLLTGTKDFSGWTKTNDAVSLIKNGYRGLTVSVASGDWQYMFQDINLTKGKKYTLSAYVKSSHKDMWTAFFGYNGSGEGRFDFKEAEKWYRYNYTFVAPKDGEVRIRLETGGITGTGKKLYICGFNLVEGENKTDVWFPSTKDNINPVRFWAGTTFEDRDNAPFKVMQDGTLYATKGNFGGTFTGSIDIGNIHIRDTNNSKAIFELNTNNDAETKILLSDDQAQVNTDLILGNISNPKIKFDLQNGILNLNKIITTLKNNDKFLNLNLNNKNLCEFGDNSSKHEVNVTNGALKLNSKNDIDNAFDYVFERNEGRSDVNVNIKGSLLADNYVKVGSMKMIRRTDVGNEGVDFII